MVIELLAKMKNMRYPATQYFIKPYILLIIVVFSFQSCAQLSELSNVSKPQVSVADMNITGLSLSSVELAADIEITNPNAIAIDLSSYNYTFKINELTFLSGMEDQNTTINARESSMVKLPLEIAYSELIQTIESLRNQNTSDFNFEAAFGFTLPVFGEIEIPIQYSGEIPILKKPSINLQNISVEDISFTKADLNLELNIVNPNSFQFNMDQLSYDLEVNGLQFISGAMNENVTLASESEHTINIPVSISFLNAGMNAYRILTGNDDIQYTLKGSTTLGSNLPYFELSTFEFDRSGSVDILR